MKPNRHVQTLLAQPFMQDPDPEGTEPFWVERDWAWELLTGEAVPEITRRLQERLPALTGEVAELVAVRALADAASEMTPAEALQRATSQKSLQLMAAKVEREKARISGKVVKLRRRR